ncbi:MAG: hypothetical protein AB1512_02900 [Thermodesulfobacteriota bacterium]
MNLGRKEGEMDGKQRVVNLNVVRQQKGATCSMNGKKPEGEEVDLLLSMRADTGFLVKHERVVDRLLRSLSVKAVEKGDAGKVYEAWLIAEDRLTALRFLRFVGVEEEKAQKVYLGKLRLKTRDKEVLEKWLSTCGMLLRPDMVKATRYLMGYRNAWVKTECRGAFRFYGKTVIDLEVETDDLPLETVNSAVNLVMFSSAILKVVRDVIAEHGSHSEEAKLVLAELQETRLVVAELEQKLKHPEQK